MKEAKGSPKPVVTGRKGNIGGIPTPGRHGSHSAAMMAGVKNLVAPGPGTKKTSDVMKIRPEQNEGAMIKHDAMKTTPKMVKTAAGAPKKVVKGAVSIMAKIRPEGGIKRDSASVVKP